MALNTAEELIEDIRAGKMVILADDEDRVRTRATSLSPPSDRLSTSFHGALRPRPDLHAHDPRTLPVAAAARAGTKFTVFPSRPPKG